MAGAKGPARSRRAARRVRAHANLHMPSTMPLLGPHVHFPRRRLVLRKRGIRAYVGDSISSRGELHNPLCAQAVIFGNGFVETYSRALDPRLLGAYHALARPLSERPLFAVPGWRRRFPVVAASLDAVERKTRRVLESMCRTYSRFCCRRRAEAVANATTHRRWLGHRAMSGRRARLRRAVRNRAAKRRAARRRTRFCK
ncbi:hypothetical protein SB87_gp071 [Parapoxvirus red deer/HL953]|uniref:Uncharacterized protein n=1 Tax=Parapoxvirus red deer/HL953 TaxID=1579460 RepID=A0A0A7M9Z7_9POXV|nr:hypothetical protein SB87_gp071 [Parapoxvirus red deer/HL953]AIZ77324.1 hypothetical protein [Parapoxvirus red deer/HL953]